VAYAPDGQTFASGDQQGMLTVWEAGSGQVRFMHKGHARMIRGIAYAPDSKTLATVDGTWGSASEVKLWDVAAGTELALLERNPKDGFNCVTFAPDGTKLAAGSFAGVAQVWDMTTRKLLVTLPTLSGRIGSLAFLPDNNTLAVGGVGVGGLKLWDVAERKELAVFKPSRSAVNFVGIPPEGNSLITTHTEGQVIEWDRAGAQPQRTWALTGILQGAALAADGRHLALLNSNGTIYVVRLGSLTAHAFPERTAGKPPAAMRELERQPL
jgi:WD40 repeat protein